LQRSAGWHDPPVLAILWRKKRVFVAVKSLPAITDVHKE
jgi:hypothetical protein